jgi:eukaryotic-like serine/threonine-protein kinase
MSGADREGDSSAGAARRGEPTWDACLSGGDASFGLSSSSDVDGRLAPGTDLGGVTIVRLLAEGGMGRVYEGRQLAPARTVAVKVMRPGQWSPSAARRFEYEAEVLARLRHPHIAQIHTFGTHVGALGAVPYFVMELVEDGRPITRHAEAARLTIRERVALFRRVCAAVAHGHQKGVIHRDLKPANILCDRAGDLKVIDFGVARSIEVDREATAITRVGDVVGTLRYMSPEQLGVDGDEVDARADVYALGLVLHEIVTGCLPYDLANASYVAAARILADDAPVPTSAIETTARTSGRMAAIDARALATIAATCLAKRPADRYPTAIEVEAELGRWERGEPLVARPPSSVETLLRLARRHRAATAAGAVILASLVAAVTGISMASLRAERLRHDAEEARRTAERREADAEREAAAARAELYLSNVLLAAEARDRDNLREARRLLDAAKGLVADAAARPPIELDCLAASLDESIRSIPGGGGTVTAVAWDRTAAWLAAGTSDGSVRLHRVGDDGSESRPVTLAPHDGSVWSAAFSPTAPLVATAGADGLVRVRSVPEGDEVAVLDGHEGAVYAVTFSADGRRLVTASRDRMARVWDTTTWRESLRLGPHGGTVFAATFAPDGRTIATAARDGAVRVWDADTGEPGLVLEGNGERIFSVAYAPDGRALATGGEDGIARLWNASDGGLVAEMRHPFRVNAVAFVADGTRLATASGDGVVRLWSSVDGRDAGRLRGHMSAIWSLATVAGTTRLATGSVDGTARLWDAGDDAGTALGLGDRVLGVASSPDGAWLAASLADATVRIIDARSFTPRHVLEGAAGRVSAVRFMPDGRTIAAGSDDGGVRFWDVHSGRRRQSLALHERRIYALDVSPDGAMLATAAEDRTARLWHLPAGAPVGAPLKHPGRVLAVAFSPDGSRLATAGEDRLARVWDPATGAEVLRLAGHEAAVNWVAYSPDGRLLATAGSDAGVRLWQAHDGGLVAVLTGPARQIWKVAFSPDGTRLAAVSADGTGQLWDVPSGRTTQLLRGHTDQVWGVAFAADGHALVTGAWDGTVRLWGVSAAELARRRAAR